ncbi:MAG: hypothetical protein QM820_52345 [Minicystis sp.]
MSSRCTLLLLAAALTACDERASAGTPDAAPPAPPPTASARPSAAPTASGSAPATSGEFKVLKMVLTSEVKKKEPVDKLDAAAPGQRVWAHVTLRNRTDATKPIALVFLVGGAERAKVDLKADPSWSYRTWGYVTLRPTDSGELVAEVRDESGTVMERAKIPIKGDAKPQKKAPPPTDE